MSMRLPLREAALLGLALAVTATGSARADSTSFPTVSQTVTGQQGACLPGSTALSALTPWPQALLRPELVWPTSQGAGITVAVVGSGVDDGSGDLAGRLTLGPREFGAGSSGRDCVGHGTFLASLIAARATGPGFAGIAPQARVLAVAVTDDAGQTNAALMAAGIRAAVDQGARVVDVADALPSDSSALASAVDHAVAANVLVIAPSAADGQQQSAAAYPAAYPNVLAVTDLAPGGVPNTVGASPGSSSPSATTGAAGGGYTARVDLAAPGDAVLGIGPGTGGQYTGSGPSFAAAFVAGVAALVLARWPRLTAAQLARRLESTAYHPSSRLPDTRVGYGTVDPVAAVTDARGEADVKPGASRAPAHLSMPAPPGSADVAQSLGVLMTALGVAVAVSLVSMVLPRGRRRHWRPGPEVSRATSEQPPSS